MQSANKATRQPKHSSKAQPLTVREQASHHRHTCCTAANPVEQHIPLDKADQTLDAPKMQEFCCKQWGSKYACFTLLVQKSNIFYSPCCTVHVYMSAGPSSDTHTSGDRLTDSTQGTLLELHSSAPRFSRWTCSMPGKLQLLEKAGP